MHSRPMPRVWRRAKSDPRRPAGEAIPRHDSVTAAGLTPRMGLVSPVAGRSQPVSPHKKIGAVSTETYPTSGKPRAETRTSRSTDLLPPDMDAASLDHTPQCPPDRSMASPNSEASAHNGRPKSMKRSPAMADERTRAQLPENPRNNGTCDGLRGQHWPESVGCESVRLGRR
jgi:hypothetical protein